jgi:hypothetical protein
VTNPVEKLIQLPPDFEAVGRRRRWVRAITEFVLQPEHAPRELHDSLRATASVAHRDPR